MVCVEDNDLESPYSSDSQTVGRTSLVKHSGVSGEAQCSQINLHLQLIMNKLHYIFYQLYLQSCINSLHIQKDHFSSVSNTTSWRHTGRVTIKFSTFLTSVKDGLKYS
jgi:hypothetical protein